MKITVVFLAVAGTCVGTGLGLWDKSYSNEWDRSAISTSFPSCQTYKVGVARDFHGLGSPLGIDKEFYGKITIDDITVRQDEIPSGTEPTSMDEIPIRLTGTKSNGDQFGYNTTWTHKYCGQLSMPKLGG